MAIKANSPHTPISERFEAQATPFKVQLRTEGDFYYKLEVVRDHKERPDSTVRSGWRVRVTKWYICGGQVEYILERARPTLADAMCTAASILENYIAYEPEPGESIWRGGLL